MDGRACRRKALRDRVVVDVSLPRREDRRELGTERRDAPDDADRRTAASATGGRRRVALARHWLSRRSEIGRRLHGEELGVASAEMHELVVRPTLDDTTVVEHVDAVRRPDAGEAVRDEEDRPAAEEVAHAREEVVLRARVERRGRLVQDDERRVPKERARERDPLPLTDRNVLSAHEIRPEDRVVAIRPGIHERIGAGAFRRADDRIEVPDPFSPTSAMTSPARISRETSSSARRDGSAGPPSFDADGG